MSSSTPAEESGAHMNYSPPQSVWKRIPPSLYALMATLIGFAVILTAFLLYNHNGKDSELCKKAGGVLIQVVDGFGGEECADIKIIDFRKK